MMMTRLINETLSYSCCTSTAYFCPWPTLFTSARSHFTEYTSESHTRTGVRLRKKLARCTNRELCLKLVLVLYIQCSSWLFDHLTVHAVPVAGYSTTTFDPTFNPLWSWTLRNQFAVPSLHFSAFSTVSEKGLKGRFGYDIVITSSFSWVNIWENSSSLLELK